MGENSEDRCAERKQVFYLEKRYEKSTKMCGKVIGYAPEKKNQLKHEFSVPMFNSKPMHSTDYFTRLDKVLTFVWRNSTSTRLTRVLLL